MDGRVMEWFDKLTKHCENKSFELSEHWESVVQGLIRKAGSCPCRLGTVPCPCQFHEKEIAEKGHCHCGLFVLKKEK